MKKCNRCKVEKNEDQFTDGKSRCINCVNWWNDYYKENRTNILSKAKRNCSKNRPHKNAVKRAGIRKNPISYILWQIKARAKRDGIAFNLSHEDIIIPKFCPVLGIELKISDGKSSFCSPSVDRIIPNLGYTKGNISIISHRANTIKSDATSIEIEKVLKYVKSMETR